MITDNKKIIVTKASGEFEIFDENKLINSLKKAGAKEDVIKQILEEITNTLYHEIKTKTIYQKAFDMLDAKNSITAKKYNLRNSLMKFGPDGFVFEGFVAKVFDYIGYTTVLNSIISGKFVTHEIDVLAAKENTQIFVECKYHLNSEKRVGVQVPLYVNSRVNDIIAVRKKNKNYKGFNFEGEIVTNTRFSADSIAFGEGVGLKLLGWDYPYHEGLKEIIENEKIYPITLISSIPLDVRKLMYKDNLTTTRQILENNSILDSYKMSQDKKQRIIDQINSLSL